MENVKLLLKQVLEVLLNQHHHKILQPHFIKMTDIDWPSLNGGKPPTEYHTIFKIKHYFIINLKGGRVKLTREKLL